MTLSLNDYLFLFDVLKSWARGVYRQKNTFSVTDDVSPQTQTNSFHPVGVLKGLEDMALCPGVWQI